MLWPVHSQIYKSGKAILIYKDKQNQNRSIRQMHF